MKQPSTIHSTFVIERSYPAAPDRVFAAFADPAKKRRWFLESGSNKIEQYELDFNVGGKEYARFRFTKEGTPVYGLECINSGTYQDIVTNRRVVLASTMAIGGKPISASLVTFEFLPSGAGTDLIFTHQGAFFEGADGPEMREAGWRSLLERLNAEFPI
jgi:uncharacterized protein YndB with AHSA1/START domain